MKSFLISALLFLLSVGAAIACSVYTENFCSDVRELAAELPDAAELSQLGAIEHGESGSDVGESDTNESNTNGSDASGNGTNKSDVSGNGESGSSQSSGDNNGGIASIGGGSNGTGGEGKIYPELGEAFEALDRLDGLWEHHRKALDVFVTADYLNQAEQSLIRLKAYLECGYYSDYLAEKDVFDSVIEQIRLRETLSPENLY